MHDNLCPFKVKISTVAKLFDSVHARLILYNRKQYSITFCSLPEVASDAISGTTCLGKKYIFVLGHKVLDIFVLLTSFER